MLNLFTSRLLALQLNNARIKVSSVGRKTNGVAMIARARKPIDDDTKFISNYSAAFSFRRGRVPTVNDMLRCGTLLSKDLGFEHEKMTTIVMTNKLQAIVASTKILNADEWQSLKQQAVNEWGSSASSFESRMMVACSNGRNYSLGRSLMQFSRACKSPVNLVTLSKYLRLCADSREECDEAHIFEVYDELSRRQPVFDAVTVCDIVHGLCRTSRWKDSLPHVETISLTCNNVPPSALEDLARAAFRTGERDDGWKFLEQIGTTSETGKLSDNLCQELIDLVSTDIVTMERLLAYMREHEVLVSNDVMLKIKYWFERRNDDEWRGNVTSVDENGVCQACGSQMENIRLSEADFELLRSNFISRVIEGNDVYLKTNPYELEKFIRFVKKTSPYSIVLDGLNVSFNIGKFYSSPNRLAEQLLKSVRQLDRGPNSRKMMVLGRHHMGKWPKDIMREIGELAHVFFLDDNSKDDPFMLYAAMHSGQGTYFVSKDLMRDHLFSLTDNRLKTLFKQWQMGNQLLLLTNNSVKSLKFKAPISHRVVVQRWQSESSVGWHVPYNDGSTRLAQDVPNAWLCLTRTFDTANLPSKVSSDKSRSTTVRN